MHRFLFLIAALHPGIVSAAQPTPFVGSSEIVSMLTSTAVVIAVIVALGWLYSRSKLAGTGSRDVIQVVASRALGAKERLLLVEIADQQLLIGMTSANVQTLHVFEKPIDIHARTDEPLPTFSARLKSSMRELRK